MEGREVGKVYNYIIISKTVQLKKSRRYAFSNIAKNNN